MCQFPLDRCHYPRLSKRNYYSSQLRLDLRMEAPLSQRQNRMTIRAIPDMNGRIYRQLPRGVKIPNPILGIYEFSFVNLRSSYRHSQDSWAQPTVWDRFLKDL
jgi:hypothetical protein